MRARLFADDFFPAGEKLFSVLFLNFFSLNEEDSSCFERTVCHAAARLISLPAKMRKVLEGFPRSSPTDERALASDQHSLLDHSGLGCC